MIQWGGTDDYAQKRQPRRRHPDTPITDVAQTISDLIRDDLQNWSRVLEVRNLCSDEKQALKVFKALEGIFEHYKGYMNRHKELQLLAAVRLWAILLFKAPGFVKRTSMEFARSVLTMIRNQSLSNVIKLRLAITIVTASRKYGQQYPIFIKLQEGSIQWVEERELIPFTDQHPIFLPSPPRTAKTISAHSSLDVQTLPPSREPSPQRSPAPITTSPVVPKLIRTPAGSPTPTMMPDIEPARSDNATIGRRSRSPSRERLLTPQPMSVDRLTLDCKLAHEVGQVVLNILGQVNVEDLHSPSYGFLDDLRVQCEGWKRKLDQEITRLLDSGGRAQPSEPRLRPDAPFHSYSEPGHSYSQMNWNEQELLNELFKTQDQLQSVVAAFGDLDRLAEKMNVNDRPSRVQHSRAATHTGVSRPQSVHLSPTQDRAPGPPPPIIRQPIRTPNLPPTDNFGMRPRVRSRPEVPTPRQGLVDVPSSRAANRRPLPLPPGSAAP